MVYGPSEARLVGLGLRGALGLWGFGVCCGLGLYGFGVLGFRAWGFAVLLRVVGFGL